MATDYQISYASKSVLPYCYRSVVIISAMISAYTHNGFAQAEMDRRSHLISVSPVVLRLYSNIRYWGFIDSRFALGAGVHVPWRSFADDSFAGYGVLLEPRYYFAHQDRFEWYVAPSFSFGFVRHEDTTNAPFKLMATIGADVFTDESKHLTVGLGLSFGYIWNVTQIFA